MDFAFFLDLLEEAHLADYAINGDGDTGGETVAFSVIESGFESGILVLQTVDQASHRGTGDFHHFAAAGEGLKSARDPDLSHNFQPAPPAASVV